jgi:hypothetical protein
VILSKDVTFDKSSILQQEKSQEKKKQLSDAQQVEFETSVILVKTIKIVPTKEDSNESIDETDLVTPITTQQQESIATSKLKSDIKN